MNDIIDKERQWVRRARYNIFGAEDKYCALNNIITGSYLIPRCHICYYYSVGYCSVRSKVEVLE